MVAAINTKRNYIGIEKNKEYFDIGYNRIQEALVKMSYKSETTELHNGLLQW
jgi:DNA modification methylase